MDYNIIANDVLSKYPIARPEIQFIRHNENITYKVIDRISNKNYLLRIHKPVMKVCLGFSIRLKA
jgi:hypothetical protein